MDGVYGTILVIGLVIFLMGTHYLLWRVGIFRGRKADQMWGSAPRHTPGATQSSHYVILDEDDEASEWQPWP